MRGLRIVVAEKKECVINNSAQSAPLTGSGMVGRSYRARTTHLGGSSSAGCALSELVGVFSGREELDAGWCRIYSADKETIK